MNILISEALAHETLYPHLHPHAQFSTLEDIAFTILFAGVVIAGGRLVAVAVRRFTRPGATRTSSSLPKK